MRRGANLPIEQRTFMTFRLGLAGLGTIHPMHAYALARLPDFEVAAAYDPRPDARCALPDVDRAETLAELLDRSDLDAILVAVPTLDHFEVTRQALVAGRHVVLEKPVAVNSVEFETLYRIVEERNRTCFAMLHDSVGDEIVHFQEELLPSLAPTLGRLKSVHSTYHDPYDARGELEERRSGLVGSWLDSASNALSVVCRFVDRLRVLEATVLLDAPGSPDTQDVEARVRFTGHAVGADESHPVAVAIDTSWLDDRKTKGTCLEYEGGSVLLQHRSRRIVIRSPEGEQSIDATTDLDRLGAQYIRVFRDFARSLERGIDNRDFAASIHRPLLNIYSDDRLVRRYRCGGANRPVLA